MICRIRGSYGGMLTFIIILILVGLLTSLFVPRRRLWVKAVENPDGSLTLEYAGLARGDDPNLLGAVTAVADQHSQALSGPPTN